jgi:hypothetical protein
MGDRVKPLSRLLAIAMAYRRLVSGPEHHDICCFTNAAVNNSYMMQ